MAHIMMALSLCLVVYCNFMQNISRFFHAIGVVIFVMLLILWLDIMLNFQISKWIER